MYSLHLHQVALECGIIASAAVAAAAAGGAGRYSLLATSTNTFLLGVKRSDNNTGNDT